MITTTERGKSVTETVVTALSSKEKGIWSKSLRIGLGAVMALGFAVGGANPAAAAPNVALGCQTTKANMTWTNGNTSNYSCSGTYYPASPNIYGRSFYAAGWSGKLIIGDGTAYRPFCDWQKIDLGGIRVREVVLYATKFCE
ncbi:hypothetical protein ACQPYV_33800 [Micromonospora saelicesensis]|nr:hypothetical protein [Micromonospora saelicesensis]